MKNLTFDFETIDFNQIGQWPIEIRTLILFLVLCITVYLGYLSFIENAWIKLDEKNQKVKLLEEELNHVEKELKHYESFNKEADKVRRNLEILRRQVSSHNEMASVLEEIAKQALPCRLQILTIKPQPEVHKGNYVEHPIIVSMVGDFHGLGEFVSRLLNMAPMISLQDYSLSHSKSWQALDIQLLLKTYRLEDFQEGEQEEKEISIGNTKLAKLEHENVPEVSQQKTYSYHAGNIRSPFEKMNLSSMDKPTMEHQEGKTTEQGRLKELLELYPLDSLKMVGFIERNHVVFGLVRDTGGNIHRVKLGDYMGQNEGKIENIGQEGIEIRESLFKDASEPLERQIILPLTSKVDGGKGDVS